MVLYRVRRLVSVRYTFGCRINNIVFCAHAISLVFLVSAYSVKLEGIRVVRLVFPTTDGCIVVGSIDKCTAPSSGGERRANGDGVVKCKVSSFGIVSYTRLCHTAYSVSETEDAFLDIFLVVIVIITTCHKLCKTNCFVSFTPQAASDPLRTTLRPIPAIQTHLLLEGMTPPLSLGNAASIDNIDWGIPDTGSREEL
ncbi:unnamed protein product [Danaus chrysippus]|uniref:(African queen) hypothetical protein n=1 Tax=Danaus chrysippus TaxID=151541 RepID=A0A8J2QHP0_9NEOP|nr:unnamed protein product [Danaus chrysippus]